MIGFTCGSAFRPLEVLTGDENQPWGMRTKLGWCVVGPRSAGCDDEQCDVSHVVNSRFACNAACKEIFIDPQISSADSSVSELTSEVKVSAEDLEFLDMIKKCTS